MPKLRKALINLTDEKKKVENRLDYLNKEIDGIGKNIASAILIIMNPNKYGVWNNRSESRMKLMSLLPGFDRGDTFGKKYVKVNAVLRTLSNKLEIDLWTLDALWWFMDQVEDAGIESVQMSSLDINQQITGSHIFGLEKHLHEFLIENWQNIELGKDWAIYIDPDNDETGSEFRCEVGRIDILARHKTKNEWLVVELKRGRTSDKTVGQLLRYIGWVKECLAKPNDIIRGLIICRHADKRITYALKTVENVEVIHYEVEFRLKNLD